MTTSAASMMREAILQLPPSLTSSQISGSVMFPKKKTDPLSIAPHSITELNASGYIKLSVREKRMHVLPSHQVCMKMMMTFWLNLNFVVNPKAL